jgi:integrase
VAFGDGGGLVLQATANAKGGVTKSWLLRYQIKKRQRWMGLDSARVVGLAEARAKANEARKLLAAGIDPIAHRDAERMAARAAELHAASFKKVLDQLLASHGDQWSAAHLEQWRSSMATYAKPLFNVAVADIDVAMVLKVIEPQWRRAPVTMDRVRGRIGEVLGFAEARGFRKPGPLPTRWKHHLDKLLPCPRTLNGVVHFPAMKHDDVPQLFAKLISSNSIPELCLAFTILTAVRSNEARGARWDEIDLATGTWTIPAIRMKTRKEHRVPLSQEALQLIERLPRRGEFLFSLNGNAPIVSISLTRVLKRHAGGDVTVHGFRSSFRDWGAERTSVSRELLEWRSGMPRLHHRRFRKSGRPLIAGSAPRWLNNPAR